MNCEMSLSCNEPVTYIGEKGYIYCTTHGLMRQRLMESTRQMQPWEICWISEGRPLPSYQPGPEPK